MSPGCILGGPRHGSRRGRPDPRFEPDAPGGCRVEPPHRRAFPREIWLFAPIPKPAVETVHFAACRDAIARSASPPHRGSVPRNGFAFL